MLHPDDFQYTGPPIAPGLRRSRYPAPDRPWLWPGYAAWPELYRCSNGQLDFRLVSTTEAYSRESRFLESRFTEFEEIRQLLGESHGVKEYPELNATVYEYSECVWLAVRNNHLNSVMLSLDRSNPAEKPGWSFVFVHESCSGVAPIDEG